MTDKKLFFSLLLILISFSLSAQFGGGKDVKLGSYKSIRPKKKKKDSIQFTAKDYKRINYLQDTISVDTTLTIQTYYKHNSVEKDMFGYMPLSNMGQTYNALHYSFRGWRPMPLMGATAKDYLYLTPEDIYHYRVPTAFTDLKYRNGIEQGQVLDALFTANISPQLNLFVAYKGLRSLGAYQNILASNGNFRAGISYISPNQKYVVFLHYANHKLMNQENGGLSREEEQFESGDPQFLNRATLDVRMVDAKNTKKSKRYFLNHEYHFLDPKAKNQNKQLTLKNQIIYENQGYKYEQKTSNDYFGESYVPQQISDSIALQKLHLELGAKLELPYLGQTYVYGKMYHYNYHFQNLFYKNGELLPNRIKNTDYSIGAEWHEKIGKFHIDAKGEQILLGKMIGTLLHGKLSFVFNKTNRLAAGLQLQSAMPNFNMLLYQSDYKAYNWSNIDNFKKINNQTIFADIQTKWGDVSVDISNIGNYTYLKVLEPKLKENPQSKPVQYSANIQYLKVKLHKEFKLWKFSLDNTVMYQKLVQDSPVINVPEITTRNTLYFTTYLFEKAMYLQTGVSFNYFTEYYSNRYNPLLSEFEVQNQKKIGGFPMLDYFINARVQTMRIYLKAENFSAPFTGYNYYSAPSYPYRDFVIRVGIAWNFFS